MKIKTLEKKRYSILTNNLDRCYMCPNRKQHLHEIFFGRNRINSMKYGCVIPVCFSCHEKIHNNHDLDIKLKKECQKRFMETYEASIDDFIDIFRKNYL